MVKSLYGRIWIIWWSHCIVELYGRVRIVWLVQPISEWTGIVLLSTSSRLSMIDALPFNYIELYIASCIEYICCKSHCIVWYVLYCILIVLWMLGIVLSTFFNCSWVPMSRMIILILSRSLNLASKQYQNCIHCQTLYACIQNLFSIVKITKPT